MKLFSLSILLIGLLQSLSQAQEEEAAVPTDSVKNYEMDEMIITGTRSLRKIIDIPYSVERINNYEYRFERKNSTSDVLGNVSGLFLQNRYGNHDVRISIRGFGSRSNSGIRGVRILLDGIPESEPDGQTRIEAIDFQSIGRIEVVKGNSSSLYTNAPGGVVNFINDIDFTQSHVVQFNEFSSFNSRNNGFKIGLKGEGYKFLTTVTHHTSQGYRPHSSDYWNIMNSVYETSPNDLTKLSLLLYYADGIIRLPGSLTQAQYASDPFSANPRDEGRDAKRITKKGRLGVRYNTLFGEERSNEIELTGYGTIKYFERTAGTYRIIDRSGVGGSARWTHKTSIMDLPLETSLGIDFFVQDGPIVEYPNLGGYKGEPVTSIVNEKITNLGEYFTTTLSLVPDKFDVLITGRYDKIIYNNIDRNLEVKNSLLTYEAFTPKFALNYKLTPVIALFTSYGYSFDSPATNELDNHPLSSNFPQLLNPDLKPQHSRNIEIGTKGIVLTDGEYFSRTRFELVFFNIFIQDEIVPFSIGSDVFFRNAAETNRNGIEVGLSMEIVKGLTYHLAYTYSVFSYNKYIARSYTAAADTVTDKSFSGKEVPSVPKHNVSTNLQYQHRLFDNITGFLKTNFNFVSGMFVNDENSTKTGDYQLVNSTIGTDVILGKMNIILSAGINNVFNKSHIAFININSDRDEYFEAGEPRNYFLSLNIGYTF